MPADSVRSLVASLGEPFTAGPVYLLVDPMLGPLDELPPYLERYPVPSDGLGITAEQAPFLVEFQKLDELWFEASLAWAAAEHLKACAAGSGACNIGGWLQPHEPGAAVDLAEQVGALLQAHGAVNGGRYLRLADRRVLALLHDAARLPDALKVPAVHWTAQLQGIAHWTYLDHNFRLQSLRGRAGPMTQEPLRLDAMHWDLMAQAEAINRSLMAWQRTTHPLPDDALAQLLPALARARQRGIQRPEDQAAYAAEAVRHPAFESWPDLPRRIERSLQTQQPLADRLEALRGKWANASNTTPHTPS